MAPRWPAAARHEPGAHDAPPPAPDRAATALRAAGRTLLVLGALVLAFAGFQLWGTGLVESRAQRDLAAGLERRLAAATDREVASPPAADPQTTTSGGVPVTLPRRTGPGRPTGGPAPVAAPTPAPDLGDPVARLQIPAIGVDKTVVWGTTRDALRAGPGHYATTPLPGRPGNAAIAGHRTTHGAPFFDLDQLRPGDEIVVETVDGRFTYLVESHRDPEGNERGHRIVDPGEVDVIGDHGDNRLTLTACHPRYSARERIIVSAQLVGEPWTPPVGPAVTDPAAPVALARPAGTARGIGTDPPPDPAPATDPGPRPATGALDGGGPEAGPVPHGADDPVTASLGWQPGYAVQTSLWAAVTAALALTGWLGGRLWRRVPAYAMAVPPTTLALFHCFTSLERLLPAV